MIILVENSKESTKQLPELIYEFSKIAEYTVDVKNQVCSY